MFSYFVKRLLGAIPTMLLVGIVVFMFVHLLPGDPARIAAGLDADEATIALMRHRLGLDLPLYQQFIHYVANVFHGNFGDSLRTGRPVVEEIGARFWPTFFLTITSMVWSVVFGLIIGVVSAVWRNQWPDRVFMTLAVSGISFPSFALGLVLVQIFAVNLGWFPAIGADGWSNYVLPSITLGASVAAVMARFTRASFVEMMSDDYVRTARAKGVSEPVIIFKHTLRNALIPVITMMGLQFGFLLGGSIVVETVFSWPGLGSLMVDAVNARDYPVLQGLVLLFSFEFIVINLLVDMLYGVINPTIRYQ